MDVETKQSARETVEKTVEAAEKTVRNPYIIRLSQFGFYTKAFLFGVIAILALQVALDAEGGRLTDATGALSTIAQKSYGKILLIVFIVGGFGHGLWNILRGIADVDDSGKGWQGITKRVISVGVGIFYLSLAWTAWDIILSVRVTAESSQAEETFTAILLAIPLGVILVFLIGLCVIGAGFHECYSGISGKFQENYRTWEIEGIHLKFITILGILSFTARALILVLIGYFFVSAAIGNDPNEVSGMDGALLVLTNNSFGRILLFFTAIGLASHSILALYEAKYRRIC